MSEQINITLPDGSIRKYAAGVSSMDIALSISEGLARNVLAAKVNGQVWDETRPNMSVSYTHQDVYKRQVKK